MSCVHCENGRKWISMKSHVRRMKDDVFEAILQELKQLMSVRRVQKVTMVTEEQEQKR